MNILKVMGRGIAKFIFWSIDVIKKSPMTTLALIFLLSLLFFFGKSNNTLKGDIALCNNNLGTCQQNLTQLMALTENERTTFTNQLAEANESVEECLINLENQKEKIEEVKQLVDNEKKEVAACKSQIVQKDVEISNKTLEVIKISTQKDIMQANYDALERNFARDKCCPTYPFFSTSNNDLVCCYQDKANNFICGAGVITSQNKTKQLLCS